jgi:hypothetical protein
MPPNPIINAWLEELIKDTEEHFEIACIEGHPYLAKR